MSFTNARQPIAPVTLLQEAISQVNPIYLSLLAILSPSSILAIFVQLLPPKQVTTIVLSAFTNLIVAPIIAGVGIYFCYRYLKHGTIDLQGAVNRGISKIPQLIGGMILYIIAVVIGLLFLIIPGIYLSVILGFFLYILVCQNLPLIDSFKQSIQLVKGRWWSVFGSMLLSLLFYVPIFMAGFIIGVIAAISKLNNIEVIAGIIGGIMGWLITPPLMLYFVKVFSRLEETANPHSST
jgi:hypothetical protein